MLFIWKLQSIINQLKIFSKTFNTFPLLSRMYSLCSIGDSNAKSLHRSLNLNHQLVFSCNCFLCYELC
ncbi:hypothetical protein Hanom_Chr15g01388791 [Helianthus anomalus]